jgi:hypothetical protein
LQLCMAELWMKIRDLPDFIATAIEGSAKRFGGFLSGKAARPAGQG